MFIFIAESFWEHGVIPPPSGMLCKGAERHSVGEERAPRQSNADSGGAELLVTLRRIRKNTWMGGYNSIQVLIFLIFI